VKIAGLEAARYGVTWLSSSQSYSRDCHTGPYGQVSWLITLVYPRARTFPSPRTQWQAVAFGGGDPP